MAITQMSDSFIRIYHSRQATLHTAPEELSSTPVPTSEAFAQFTGINAGKNKHRNAGSRLSRTESVSITQETLSP